MIRCNGAVILADCEAQEAVAASRAKLARKTYLDLLAANAPQHVVTNRSARDYESDPSYDNHLAYQAEWTKLCRARQAVEQAQAERMQALAAHSAAWSRVEAIRRLRKASLEVQALGYDPRAFI